MSVIEDYVARVEETCGEERNFIVLFRYEKKDEAIAKIRKNAKLVKSLSGIAFDMTFKDVSFRFYITGKAVFRGLKSKAELQSVLGELLM